MSFPSKTITPIGSSNVFNWFSCGTTTGPRGVHNTAWLDLLYWKITANCYIVVLDEKKCIQVMNICHQAKCFRKVIHQCWVMAGLCRHQSQCWVVTNRNEWNCLVTADWQANLNKNSLFAARERFQRIMTMFLDLRHGKGVTSVGKRTVGTRVMPYSFSYQRLMNHLLYNNHFCQCRGNDSRCMFGYNSKRLLMTWQRFLHLTTRSLLLRVEGASLKFVEMLNYKMIAVTYCTRRESCMGFSYPQICKRFCFVSYSELIQFWGPILTMWRKLWSEPWDWSR